MVMHSPVRHSDFKRKREEEEEMEKKRVKIYKIERRRSRRSALSNSLLFPDPLFFNLKLLLSLAFSTSLFSTSSLVLVLVLFVCFDLSYSSLPVYFTSHSRVKPVAYVLSSSSCPLLLSDRFLFTRALL